jgi:allophanate hydrolase subunit 2
MGLRADIIQGLEKYEITKIEGQPTEEDLTQLTLELSSALGSVATTLGGGEHGHVGLIIDEAEYVTFSRNGEKFVAPTNPGAYPASPDADAVVREQQIAEHKAKQDEFVKHQAVEAFARQAIASAVEPEWLAEIKSDTMGYNLKKCGGTRGTDVAGAIQHSTFNSSHFHTGVAKYRGLSR